MFSKKTSITFLFAVSAAASSYAGPGAKLGEALKGASAREIEAVETLQSQVAKSSDAVVFEPRIETFRLNPELQEGSVKPIAGLSQNHLDKTLVTFTGLDKKGGISTGAFELPTGTDKLTGAQKSAYSYKLDISTIDASVKNTKDVKLEILEGTTSHNSRNQNYRRVMARVIQDDGSVITHTRQVNLGHPEDSHVFLGSTFNSPKISGKIDTVKGDTSVLRIDIKNKEDSSKSVNFDFNFRRESEIGKFFSEHSGAALDSAYVMADQKIVLMMKDSTGQVTPFQFSAKPNAEGKRFLIKLPVSGRETLMAVEEIKGRESLAAQNTRVKNLGRSGQSSAGTGAAQ